ncbi:MULTISPECIES: sugar 3,4-ketoisomerase [Helicobacter]|uniref:FdtA/QdtA family cupin domain-containing protein n=1 Tax=Helicobacter ibis TaxID=2962633 RepID=A0ABT4VGX5_9HELI|nr:MULTISPECIES: FdtA/QdtA family cupin domain-containing protein [Helicobacter]MDA3967719.1 FdtA/QdtA family cupin domain-containing protein [Helicobacter sp. WB40]MDA3969438.1 FdtA/QdtA family cupin domain-containing protein [Helicobacter ibis]
MDFRNYKLLNFSVMGDLRGNLVSLEENKNIPFCIKRVYYIYNTSDKERGFHAHTRLEQVAVVLSGECEFVLDSGKSREVIKLDTPSVGLYIGIGIWREMRNFSSNCVLMVLASEYYDENEYIRDYDEFLKFKGIK